jgi:eukaryotic-like serine/threonine-protein kinase
MDTRDALNRDLLFGLLALQTGMIDQDVLVAAFRAWTRDKSRPIAAVLADQGAVDPGDRDAVEALVLRHLRKHGDDAGRSLAAVAAPASIVASLACLGDHDVDVTLGHLPGSRSGPTVRDEVQDASATVSMGGATSDGRRFRLLRPHARGGLGEVFVALDVELNREVALKQILDRHADDPNSRTRFVLEAEITGGLEHPGIVPVYGLGAYGDGRPYYAMRFIRGDSLKEAIDRFHKDASLRADPGKRSLALRKLLRRFTDVCNAIEYAHSRGVLHRDIKPANVIVGKHGETLVVDWGLAKPMGKSEVVAASDERALMPSSASGSAETLPGSALGTPAYMSPEQASGALDRLGPRSDVYSLGATLYCLLTGKQPFEGDDLGAVLRAVGAGEFPPPRSVEPTIDRALEAVCLKAMATAPEGRYASPRGLADDVERWAADEPVTAWREPLSVRVAHWLRRHRHGVATAGVALAVAALGLGVVAAVQTGAKRRLDLKNRELVEANGLVARSRDQAERRVGLALEAIGSFANAVDNNLDVKNRPENEPLRKAMLQGPLEFYKKLRDDLRAGNDARPEAQAELAEAYRRLASLTHEIGGDADALAALDESAAILEPLTREPPPALRIKLLKDLSKSLVARGALRRQNGRGEGAEQDYRRARALLEGLVRDDPGDASHHKDLAQLLYGTTFVQASAGDADAALETLRTALGPVGDALRLTPGDVSLRTLEATIHQRTGAILANQKGRTADAMASLRSALAIIEPLAKSRPDDVETQIRLADCYRVMADVLEQAGRHEESLEYCRRRLATIDALIAARPTVNRLRHAGINAARAVASALGEIGRNAEALAMLERAKVAGDRLVRESPTNTDYLNALATVQSAIGAQQYGLGRTAEALASMEAATALQERMVAANPRDVDDQRDLAGSHYNIGYMRAALGRDDALAAYDRSLALRRRLSAEHPEDPRFDFDASATLGNMAGIHFTRGQLSKAREAYGSEVAILVELARKHPDSAEYQNYLARARGNLASMRSTLGDFDGALPLLVDALTVKERLAGAEPSFYQYQEDLAGILEIYGTLERRMGRLEDAERRLRRAFVVAESLVRLHPKDPSAISSFAACGDSLARICMRRDNPSESLAASTRVVEVVRPALERDPDSKDFRRRLASALRLRAEAHARLGRPDQARAEMDRCEPLEGDDFKGLGPAFIAAWLGDHRRAMSEVASLDAGATTAASRCVDLARVAALASTAARSDPSFPPAERTRLAEADAVLALALLRRANSLHEFDREDRRCDLKDDRILGPFFDREDFRSLYLDLGFPADQFAR